MPTYRFDEISRSKTSKFKCPCGRRFQRTVTAMQTVSPFNRDADGRPKTVEQITVEVNAEIAAKQPDPTCKCGQTAVEVKPKLVTR